MNFFPDYGREPALGLLAHLPLGQMQTAAELGPTADGWLAHQILARLPATAKYTAFTIEATPQVKDSRFCATPAPLCELSLPERSLDLLVVAYSLNSLPQRLLYMALAEARRLVRPGGWLGLVSNVKAPGLLAQAKAALGPRRLPPWEPMHFISPEDWGTERQLSTQSDGVPSKAVILRRLE